MIASLNIVAKTFARLSATIIATTRRPGLQNVNSGKKLMVKPRQSQRSTNDVNRREDDISSNLEDDIN